MIDAIAVILLACGTLLMAIAGIGLLILPDFLCRSHAVAKSMTLGIILLLIAAGIHVHSGPGQFKMVLAVFFQLFTIPIASHLLGRLAFRKNISRWRETPLDDHRRRDVEKIYSGNSNE